MDGPYSPTSNAGPRSPVHRRGDGSIARVMDSPSGRPKHIDLSLSSGERLAAPPHSPVRINRKGVALVEPSSAQIETLSAHSRTPSSEHPPVIQNVVARNSFRARSPDSTIRPTSSTSWGSVPASQPGPRFPNHLNSLSSGERMVEQYRRLSPHMPAQHTNSPQIIATDESGNQSAFPDSEEMGPQPEEAPEPVPQLSYFHNRAFSQDSGSKSLDGSGGGLHNRTSSQLDTLARPISALNLNDDGSRSTSPGLSVPRQRDPKARSSSAVRPKSYIEQLNDPYVEPAPAANLHNDQLRPTVGLSASLLSSGKTFEMYLANIKKTPDMKVQYDFALFMIQAAREARAASPNSKPIEADSPLKNPDNLVKEARKILEKLASNSYPFAQYFLADGYASGAFTKNGEPDDGAAFPLFIAASKHGHAEAGYRAGLCYEYGWGCSKSGPRAEQYFRNSASKGHPGSMSRLSKACLSGDLGNAKSEREGVRWLRRAAEAADQQFFEAPYLLGRLHETGYGSDVFKDAGYAATLYTRAAELGHADAAYRMGKAYEHGELDCPNDPPLSVHFYSKAAEKGHPEAMMGLVAWYMVGAPGFLEADEAEAFEWAKAAAETDLPKAAYALAYFHEGGVGCRRDPLEANKWYVRAAEMGEERAKLRLRMLRDAASGKNLTALPVQEDGKNGKKSRSKSRTRNGEEEGGGAADKKKKFGIF